MIFSFRRCEERGDEAIHVSKVDCFAGARNDGLRESHPTKKPAFPPAFCIHMKMKGCTP
jgi:hypothetical protein